MGKTELLEKLRKTIEQDPAYFVKVKTDKILNNIRPEVDDLLDEMNQEKKTKAISAITKVETSFSKAPQIVSNAEKAFHNLRKNSVLRSKSTYEESQTKYKDAQNKLELAKRKVASGEYVAFLDAKKIAEEAQKVVNESYKLVGSAIDTATNEEERAIKEEKRYNQKKTYHIIKTVILSPLLIYKAALVGIIGMIIGAVIGVVIGPLLSHNSTIVDIALRLYAIIGPKYFQVGCCPTTEELVMPIFAGAGWIIVAFLYFIDDNKFKYK